VEKQYYVFLVCICILNYPTRNGHAPYNIAICGLSLVCFWLCELLYGICVLEGYSHVCMFEQVGDFSYFWTIIREGCPSFVFFLSLVCSWLFLLCYICRFSLCTRFYGKLLFLAISCIDVHTFCLFFGINGRECILVIWYLKAVILCPIGWFEKKLMVVSVVVFFSKYVSFEARWLLIYK
jgi:hypothetical protein